MKPQKRMAGDRDSAIKREIGAKLRAVREERGHTVDDLSLLSSVSRSTISAVENGVQAPQIDNLIRLAAALAIQVEDLMPDDYGRRFSPLERLAETGGIPLSAVRVLRETGALSSARSTRRSSTASSKVRRSQALPNGGQANQAA